VFNEASARRIIATENDFGHFPFQLHHL